MGNQCGKTKISEKNRRVRSLFCWANKNPPSPSRQSIERSDVEGRSGVCDLDYLQPPEFCAAHRKTVVRTWSLMENHITEIGMRAYLQLFQRDPQTIIHFPFLKHISLDEYEHFFVLRNHAIRVMGMINMLVKQLASDESDQEIAQTLKELGEHHYGYGASCSDVELLGLLFFESFMVPFAEHPDYPDIRGSWQSFFQMIVYWLQEGIKYVHSKGSKESPF